jgi:hypothetical protein
MTQAWMAIGILSLAIFSPPPAEAIRCGDLLIREGDTAYEVRTTLANQNCGAVVSETTVALEREGRRIGEDGEAEDRRYRETVRPVRRWIIRVQNIGGVFYCYPLRFRSGIVEEIGIGRRCDP